MYCRVKYICFCHRKISGYGTYSIYGFCFSNVSFLIYWVAPDDSPPPPLESALHSEVTSTLPVPVYPLVTTTAQAL
jgi:hypothetical protein